MKLQYIGAGKEDPVKTKIYGIDFELNGKPVEVTDPKIAKKLSGNPTFRVVDGNAKPEKTEKAAEAPTPAATPAAADTPKATKSGGKKASA